MLIRIETKAGHGAGKPTSKRIDEMTDVLSFMLWNTGTEVESIKNEGHAARSGIGPESCPADERKEDRHCFVLNSG